MQRSFELRASSTCFACSFGLPALVVIATLECSLEPTSSREPALAFSDCSSPLTSLLEDESSLEEACIFFGACLSIPFVDGPAPSSVVYVSLRMLVGVASFRIFFFFRLGMHIGSGMMRGWGQRRPATTTKTPCCASARRTLTFELKLDYLPTKGGDGGQWAQTRGLFRGFRECRGIRRTQRYTRVGLLWGFDPSPNTSAHGVTARELRRSRFYAVPQLFSRFSRFTRDLPGSLRGRRVVLGEGSQPNTNTTGFGHTGDCWDTLAVFRSSRLYSRVFATSLVARASHWVATGSSWAFTRVPGRLLCDDQEAAGRHSRFPLLTSPDWRDDATRHL